MKCGPNAIFNVPPEGPDKKPERDTSAHGHARASHGEPRQEVYLEFLVVGEAVKVIAVDAETGVEVSIMGSIHSPNAELERVVVNKLRYVQGLKSGGAQKSSSDDRPVDDRAVKNGGKGWVV